MRHIHGRKRCPKLRSVYPGFAASYFLWQDCPNNLLLIFLHAFLFLQIRNVFFKLQNVSIHGHLNEMAQIPMIDPSQTQVGITSQIDKWANKEPWTYWR